MQVALNYEEQLFFEYLQGGSVPDEYILKFQILAGQIHAAFTADYNYLNHGTTAANPYAATAKF